MAVVPSAELWSSASGKCLALGLVRSQGVGLFWLESKRFVRGIGS